MLTTSQTKPTHSQEIGHSDMEISDIDEIINNLQITKIKKQERHSGSPNPYTRGQKSNQNAVTVQVHIVKEDGQQEGKNAWHVKR